MTSNAHRQNIIEQQPKQHATLKPHSQRYQRGMAVLAIVAIMLGVITLTTVSTTQHVQQFYVIEKAKRNSEDTKFALKLHVKKIAEALRSQGSAHASHAIKDPDITAKVDAEQLEGSNHQPLTHFMVSVSHKAENMKFTARFLKYPALLQIPSAGHQFSWSSDITQWMFNRDIHQLNATFFPENVIDSKCADLESSGVHWIEGNCTIDINDVDHTSKSAPMLLIVVNGNVDVSKNTHFYGLLILLSTASHVPTLNVANSATIEGAYVSNRPFNANVLGTVTPSNSVLKNLQSKNSLAKIIPVPGTIYDPN
ncbi:hypothetical protein [Alteromonas gracilis]|uniref:hypothetical protein n=1 Tax=Alteromonas gracilis TaxID=1479524 RepID=UPI00373504DE